MNGQMNGDLHSHSLENVSGTVTVIYGAVVLQCTNKHNIYQFYFLGMLMFFFFVLNIYHFNLKNIFYHMISEWDMS